MRALRFVFLTLPILTFCARSQSQQVIPLWEKVAPGFEARRSEPEQYLASLGVTAPAQKYRVFREPGSKYTIDHTAQDIRRAMRTVRE